MKILSHRGYWLEPREKNRLEAFRRSFHLGFGTETDVRDAAGQLVISHDMPSGGEMRLREFLRLVGNPGLPLALNIKADGLAKALREEMDASGHRSWFVFDMSIPDMLGHLKAGCPVYTRMSEYEPEPSILERASGVWLDAFESLWWSPADIEKLLDAGKSVCVVSPELHGREAEPAWERLRPLAAHQRLLLCTDLPEHAADLLLGSEP